jgi:hypothetical protein
VSFKTPRTVVASAARTSSGNSGAIGIDQLGEDLHLLVVTTALSGTPNVVLSVTWSHDGTNFAPLDTTVDAFAALTTQVNVTKSFPIRAPFYQVNWVVTGGSPSLTFSVSEYVTV